MTIKSPLNVPAPEDLIFFDKENFDFYKASSQGQRYEIVLRTQRRLESMVPVGTKVSVNDMSIDTLSGNMERTIENMR